MKKILNKIFYLLLLTSVIFPQSRPDSLSFSAVPYRNKILQTYFDKQLSTYNLNSALRLSHETNKMFFGINGRFRSTIIKSSSNNVKDEQNFSVIGEYKLSPLWKFGNLTNYYNYTDDRKLALNSASNFNSALYARFSPVKKINITPFAGPAVNKQIGLKDNGFVYGTEALVNNIKVNEFDIFSSFKFHNEDISPRKNTFRLINLNVKNNFENSVSNNISAHYSQQRMDFYFETDSITSATFDIKKNIQSRTESNYFLQDRIAYAEPFSNLRLNVEGRIGWRDIDRYTRYIHIETISPSLIDTRVEEFRLDFSSTAIYRTGNLSGRFKVMFSEKEEKHLAKNRDGIPESILEEKQDLESRKNNKTQLATIAASGGINISPHDKITVNLLHRKLIYDTPSEDNFDDRDELLSTLSLIYSHRFSPFFSMFLNLEGSINHIVYVLAERSSNNNFRRVLKFSGGGSYSGKNIKSSNVAEVSANYTVYDFEDLNPNFKSFAFRQLLIYDSTSVSLSSRLGLDLYGYVKFSEQGDFKWSSFSGKPVRFLEEIYMEPKFVYHYSDFKLGIGLRLFSLKTFGFTKEIEKTLDSEYSSIGPLSEFSYLLADKLRIIVYGWYEFINDEIDRRRELVNLNIRINWNI